MAKVQRELVSPAEYIPRSTVCKVCTLEAFLGFLKGVTRVNSDHPDYVSIHQRKGATFVCLLRWSSYKRNKRDVFMEHGTRAPLLKKVW